jgi:hypothetical protein
MVLVRALAAMLGDELVAGHCFERVARRVALDAPPADEAGDQRGASALEVGHAHQADQAVELSSVP